MKFVIYLITLIIIENIIWSVKLKNKIKNHSDVDELQQEEVLKSSNGHYWAILQKNGNFEVYSSGTFNGRNKDHSIWSTGTHGKGSGPYGITMQNDGNVVLYDGTGNPLWSSQSAKDEPDPPYELVMKINGNLVLYDKHNNSIWSTGTEGKK
jgi:hypothetical protein